MAGGNRHGGNAASAVDKTKVLADIELVDRQIRLLEAMLVIGPARPPSFPLWPDAPTPPGVVSFRFVDPAERCAHQQVALCNAANVAISHANTEEPYDPDEPGRQHPTKCSPPDPALFPQIQDGIRKILNARAVKQRAVARQYMEIRSEWIRKVRSQRRHTPESLERARFLLMVTRTAEMQGLAARTGSGRVTQRPVALPTSAISPQMPTSSACAIPSHQTPSTPESAAVASLSDVEVLLNEIEVAGGTATGQERWGRNLAVIPDQNPEFIASAGVGSVVLPDPLEAHYAARARNPWTQPERLLFLEKWLVHGKNFRKIATFLEAKSVYDVQRFYFQNKIRLGLKQLGRDVGSKRTARSTRRQALLTLSQDPAELYRAIPSYENISVSPDEVLDVGPPWSDGETNLFIQGVVRYRMDFTRIATLLRERDPSQCRAFYILERGKYRLDQYGPPPPVTSRKKGKKGSAAQTRTQAVNSDWSATELQEFSRNLKRFGRDWKKIAEYMPRRSIEELKARWQVNRATKSKPPLAGPFNTGSGSLNGDRKRKGDLEASEAKTAKTDAQASPGAK